MGVEIRPIPRDEFARVHLPGLNGGAMKPNGGCRQWGMVAGIAVVLATIVTMRSMLWSRVGWPASGRLEG
jgi:hypothetical protein